MPDDEIVLSEDEWRMFRLAAIILPHLAEGLIEARLLDPAGKNPDAILEEAAQLLVEHESLLENSAFAIDTRSESLKRRGGTPSRARRTSR